MGTHPVHVDDQIDDRYTALSKVVNARFQQNQVVSSEHQFVEFSSGAFNGTAPKHVEVCDQNQEQQLIVHYIYRKRDILAKQLIARLLPSSTNLALTSSLLAHVT